MSLGFVDLADTCRSRVEQHSFNRYVFFGDPQAEGPGPQMYMNEVDPGVELAAHFHTVDQFQVFFGTRGATFKRHPVSCVMVHYTDAYSTYGPFRAAADAPLLYATIRAESTNFGGVMPGARAQLVYRGRRNVTADVPDPLTLSSEGGARQEDVIASGPDAMAATVVRLGPGSEVELASAPTISGRACCILAGELVVDGRPVQARALGWAGPDDVDQHLVAGPAGANVLVLDFPSPPTRTAHVAAAYNQEEA
jgi:hypothetical protein